MKAIVIGAAAAPAVAGQRERDLSCMLMGPTGGRALDWVLSSLRSIGVGEIAFVGGYRIDDVRRRYPDLRIYHNTEWERNNVLESLFYAEAEMADGFVLSYADIVFHRSVAEALAGRAGMDTALVVDMGWRRRPHNRGTAARRSAEKVVVRDGRVVRIGKSLAEGDVTGEFIGLGWFGSRGALALREHYHAWRRRGGQAFHEARSLRDAYLTDIVQEMIDAGHEVTPVPIPGEWAEVNSARELAEFVFGTKAETLERLRPVLRCGRIYRQVRFTIDEWRVDAVRCRARVREAFGSQPVVVRSSALAEDAWASSMAGAYESVLGVPSDDPDALSAAVSRVIESYRRIEGSEPNALNQVLVQPQVRDVALSGVVLTSDLDAGAPYLVINYANGPRTDAVTAGDCAGDRVVVAYKKTMVPLPDARLEPVVSAVRELEEVVAHDALDVEFAVDGRGDVSVLQVRPIAARTSGGSTDVACELERIRAFLRDRLRPLPHLHGRTTLFGDMPDWNPAEMIGSRPNALALSLYRYLITDSAWREARARIGYHDPYPERLMVTLAGHPYIDLRSSFNSLLPTGLPDDLADRLVDHGLALVCERPELHDKIEFDAAITCLAFDFDRRASALRDAGFAAEDMAVLRTALGELTRAVLTGRVEPIGKQLAMVSRLTPRRERVLKALEAPEHAPRTVAILLDDCIRFGTIPFAVLARYAFMAEALLRSLRDRGVFADDEYQSFLRGIRTVAGDLVQDVGRLVGGGLSREAFLARYGHLRPGTYDILSYRYDERPDLYLPDGRELPLPADPPPRFQPRPTQMRAIGRLLAEHALGVGPEALVRFIRDAIAAREYAKFEFSRNVSCALSLIAAFGERLGIDRARMAHVSLEHLLRLAGEASVDGARAWLLRLSDESSAQAEHWARILLPSLIRDDTDVEAFERPVSRPNFVTARRVVAPAVVLATRAPIADLRDRIVLLECADPGFDWIFAHGIAGLVTQYGGAASHMAIRCAEFSIPAAIGCGETLYRRLRGGAVIEIDARAALVRRVT